MGPVRAANRRVEARVMRMGRVPMAALAMAFALVLALALVLAGCDSQPDPTASTAVSKTPRKPAGDGGDADLVAAFSATRGQPGLVDLKFKLETRPAVGEPAVIDVALIPSVELEHLFARFQAAEGLQIVSGSESEHFEHPATGAAVTHKITVTPKADGIFYVTAVVLADSDKESVARTFSFPVIAGQGLTESPATPPAASVADRKSAAPTP
jgi:hypothetical protein